MIETRYPIASLAANLSNQLVSMHGREGIVCALALPTPKLGLRKGFPSSPVHQPLQESSRRAPQSKAPAHFHRGCLCCQSCRKPPKHQKRQRPFQLLCRQTVGMVGPGQPAEGTGTGTGTRQGQEQGQALATLSPGKGSRGVSPPCPSCPGCKTGLA